MLNYSEMPPTTTTTTTTTTAAACPPRVNACQPTKNIYLSKPVRAPKLV